MSPLFLSLTVDSHSPVVVET